MAPRGEKEPRYVMGSRPTCRKQWAQGMLALWFKCCTVDPMSAIPLCTECSCSSKEGISAQIHEGRQLNESSSWGDRAFKGQIDIKIAQATKLPIWEIGADYIFLSYSAYFLIFCCTESFFCQPPASSQWCRASWWERPKRLRVEGGEYALVPAGSPYFLLSSCSHTGQGVLLPHLDERNYVV